MAEADRLYWLHRNTVDRTVMVASRYAQRQGEALAATESQANLWVPLAGGVSLALLLLLLWQLQVLLQRRLGGDPRLAVSVAEQIARGDLRAGSSDSRLGAMGRMRQLLTTLL